VASRRLIRTGLHTHLTSLRRPLYLPRRRRLLRERQIFSLIARVTLKLSEDDRDYHLVLRSGSRR
jgi:hypothetical protein